MDKKAFLGVLNSRPRRVTFFNLKDQDIVTTPSKLPTPYFISSCTNTNVDLSNTKAAQIMLQNCTQQVGQFKVSIGSVISSIELIACSNANIVLLEHSGGGSLVLDKCSNINVKLTFDLNGWVIYSNQCQSITLMFKNVTFEIPRLENHLNIDDDSFTELRLKTVWIDGQFQTMPCNNYGDQLH
ncbi:hypothetical protein BC833DRAFT_616906 [Globomyces pollinis-pini]|nr:hypothetical protein BC833DRAFT_616906 [Globomyces pollinis-pini]